jgi:HD-GYP domain-containing protein (c-di-GMP phosphodiesterase class II)
MKPGLAILELHHGPGFGDHGSRVAVLAYATAHHLRLSSRETSRLRLAALFHDIGKTEIDPAILEKTDPLTDKESAAIRQHPKRGHDQMVEVVHPSVADAVLCHHERWDGSGFPHGLAGTDIPLFARIILVADAFDVMTTGRSYKPKMSLVHAGEELSRLAGRQFDSKVVDALSSIRRDLLMMHQSTLVE